MGYETRETAAYRAPATHQRPCANPEVFFFILYARENACGGVNSAECV